MRSLLQDFGFRGTLTTEAPCLSGSPRMHRDVTGVRGPPGSRRNAGHDPRQGAGGQCRTRFANDSG
jgi:hypothetical protein